MERSPWAFKMYKQKIFQAPPHKQKTSKPTHINLPSPPTALGGSSYTLTAQRPMERSPWAFKMYKQKIFQAPPHKQKTTKPTHINLPSPPTALLTLTHKYFGVAEKT